MIHFQFISDTARVQPAMEMVKLIQEPKWGAPGFRYLTLTQLELPLVLKIISFFRGEKIIKDTKH